MVDIVIYTLPHCPYCVNAKNLLKTKGVAAWEERDISTSDSFKREMLEKSGGRKTVPQIFIGSRHVGGFDDLSALNKSGELDGLLK